MFKFRHCFIKIINSKIKTSTHSYTAIICTRSRDSFCCTLLACQRIKKTLNDFSKHHQGSQIVCTHLCVDASQWGRDKEESLSSVTYYILSFSQHCLLSHRELMFICSRLRLRCEMCRQYCITCWMCASNLCTTNFTAKQYSFCQKLHEQFQPECTPLSLKRQNKGIFGGPVPQMLLNIISVNPYVGISKQKIVLMHINLQWKSTGQVYLYT